MKKDFEKMSAEELVAEIESARGKCRIPAEQQEAFLAKLDEALAVVGDTTIAGACVMALRGAVIHDLLLPYSMMIYEFSAQVLEAHGVQKAAQQAPVEGQFFARPKPGKEFLN